MKIGQINQLEILLSTWEDMCLVMEGGFNQGLAEGGRCAPVQFFQNTPEFRGFLQNSFGQPFDKRFIDAQPPTSNLLQIWSMIPIFFHAWLNNSKRIYHFTNVLESMFLATSLKKIDCEDIHFPFAAFALTLERPIADANGIFYDCLLIADDVDFYGKKYLAIILLDVKWKGVRPMDQAVRERVKWAIRKKRWDKAAKKLKHLDFINAENRPHLRSYYIDKQFWRGDLQQFVRQYRHIVKDMGQDEQLALKVFQLLMGLCFFLNNLPNSILREKAKPTAASGAKPKLPIPAKIFDSGQVFTFATETIISQEEKEIFGQIDAGSLSGTPKSPHFRSGHWRRPPGCGQDPNCPKSIWVKPCVINADRLGVNQQPHGSKNILK